MSESEGTIGEIQSASAEFTANADDSIKPKLNQTEVKWNVIYNKRIGENASINHRGTGVGG